MRRSGNTELSPDFTLKLQVLLTFFVRSGGSRSCSVDCRPTTMGLGKAHLEGSVRQVAACEIDACLPVPVDELEC